MKVYACVYVTLSRARAYTLYSVTPVLTMRDKMTFSTNIKAIETLHLIDKDGLGL